MLDHDLDEIFYYVRPYDWFDVHPSGCNEWETAKKLIKEAVAKVEKRARVRKLPTHQFVNGLDELIKKRPCGLAGAEGGRVPLSYEYWADTTYLFLSWYTWRGKKVVRWITFRESMPPVPYGRDPVIRFICDRKLEAWKYTFPDRYSDFQRKRTKRLLKHLNLPVPDQAFEIVDCWEKTPAVLVAKGGRAPFVTKGWLVLPDLRIFECELEYEYQRSIKFHLESRLGVKIRKNTPWELLEAAMVLAELGR